MRWPGVIKPGDVINDWVPHGLPADLRGRSRGSGHRRQTQEGTRCRRHELQNASYGYNLLPFLSGKEPCPRDGFIYWSNDVELMVLRVQQDKLVFAEQLATGLNVWREPL